MSLTVRVAIGLVAGLLLGFAVSASHSPWLNRTPAFFEPIGVVFVNAIRVAVIPLIVSGLIVGVAASGGDARKLSRLGGRSLALILVMLSLAAVFAGAVAFPVFGRLDIDKNVAARLNKSPSLHQTSQASPSTIAQWLTELVPTNIFKAAADGALLPLIVVSLAFGLALTQVEQQRRASILQFFHGIADAFLVFVSYIVKLAPIGVFALAVPLAARMGTAAAGVLAFYIGILSAVTVAFTLLILYPAAVLFGRVPLSRFAKAAAPAQAVTLASRSSLAALPAVYEGARDMLGVREDIYDFFLPLAASMFRVGGAIVEVVGVIFLARLYGIVLNPPQLATITLAAIVTSLTVPGVPGGGVIVMAPVLASVNVPAEGIGILLAVDTIPDMFRTTANVTGWFCVLSILSRDAAATSNLVVQSTDLRAAVPRQPRR